MLKRFTRSAWLALLVLPFGTAGSMGRAAGDEAREDLFERPSLYHVRDTHVVRSTLAEAEAALARGEVRGGLASLQLVLDDMADHFARVPEQSGTASLLWRSAGEVARDILASLDASTLSVYDEIVRSTASPLLGRAVATDDRETLAELVRRYPASRYGKTAGRILAERALEEGRTRSAGEHALEVLRYAPEDTGAWRVLLQAGAARGAAEALPLAPPNSVVRAGPTTALGQAWAAWRAAAAAAQDAAASPALAKTELDWPTWGGDMRRSATLPAATPALGALRWSVRIASPRRSEERMRLRSMGIDPTPYHFRMLIGGLRPYHAAVAGGTVHVADGRSVQAFDMLSGRPAWRFTSASNVRLYREGPLEGRTSLERAFAPVVVGDTVFATVEVRRPFHEDSIGGVPLVTYLPTRRVVALDRQTGRMLWLAGEGAGADPLVAACSVVAPVAVADGVVVALAEEYRQRHDLFAVGLDARTGKLLWRRPLGYGAQELNLFNNPLKELGGTAPAIADGIAYFGTGLGLVAAVQVRTGVPVWVASYEPIPIRAVVEWYEAPIRRPYVAPTRTVVAGNTVLVAPVDARHLHAFDRRTGRLLWRTAYDADMPIDAVGYFLGVAGRGETRTAILTSHRVRAIDLATGRDVWEGRLDPERGGAVGEGAIVGDEIWVPTPQGLDRFSIAREGAWKGSVPWPEGADPGNVLPLESILLVLGDGSVQAFYDGEVVAAAIERRRLANPQDPWLAIEAAEVHLRGSRPDRARDLFVEALVLARALPDPAAEERAGSGLAAAWLAVAHRLAAAGPTEEARAAFRAAIAATPDVGARATARLALLAQIESPAERIEELLRLAGEAGAIVAPLSDGGPEVALKAWALLEVARQESAAGRPREAVDAFQRVLAEVRDGDVGGERAGDIAESGIRDVMIDHGSAPYAPHEAAAREALTKARATGDVDALDDILARWPNSSLYDEVVMARVEGYERSRDWFAAARDLRTLLDAELDPAIAAPLLLRLATVEQQRGATGAARVAALALAMRYGDVTVDSPDGKATGAQHAARRLATRAPSPPARRDARGLTVVEQLEAGDDDMLRHVPLAVDAEADAAPFALFQGPDGLVAVDLVAGRIAWTAPIRQVRRAAWVPGKLVVYVAGADVLLGLAEADGRQEWVVSLDATLRELAASRGVVLASQRDLHRDDGLLRVRAFDATIGSLLWSRSFGRADPTSLGATPSAAWVRRTRHEGPRLEQDLLVLDLFDGGLRSSAPLPALSSLDPLTNGDTLLAAGTQREGGAAVVLAIDLANGAERWRHEVPLQRASALAWGPEGHAHFLTHEGRATTLSAADGSVLAETGIGRGGDDLLQPLFETRWIVSRDKMTLLPTQLRGGAALLQFDRASGRLLFAHRLAEEGTLSRAQFGTWDEGLWVLSFFNRAGRQHASIEVLAADGAVVSRLDLNDLVRGSHPVLSVEGYGTMIVYGRAGAWILR